MVDQTPLRTGADNQGSDKRALFLKVYGGEVMTAFAENTKFRSRHKVRTIESGKSAQFPATGKKNAQYHTPGNFIQGTQMNVSERTINVDDLLIAPTFIANIDEAMQHYDLRSEYTRADGEALARVFDKNVARVGINAARSSATVSDLPGGETIQNANFKTSASDLVTGFFDAAQALDEKDVPENERYGFLKPAQYYLVIQDKNVLNRDWGGEGSYARANLPVIADIDIVKTNNLPTSNISTSDSDVYKSAYAGDFGVTAGLIMHPGSVGTVKLKDLSVDGPTYKEEYQGWLTVSKYAVGHGILRPESAVELRTGAPA